MASGVPLVASDLPVLKEVLIPEYNCLMVAPNDIEAWTGAIQRLAADPALRQRLAVQAKAEVAEKYNWPARAEAILTHLIPERVAAR
jgi:glycosyltransferase involved in cell wall biosynthesis